MKMWQILQLIDDLSQSQGLYCRLKEDIIYIKKNNPEKYEELVNDWESRNFKDSLDFILYIEC